MNGNVRSSIRELDNRDMNETWIHMDWGDIDPDILEVSFDESIDILVSFIENGINEESTPEVVEMVKRVYKKLDDLMREYGVDIS